MKKLCLSLFLFFLFFSSSLALEIKQAKIYRSHSQLILSLFFKNFPVQEIVLALKEQKHPVYLNFSFEFFKKRFLLSDVLIHKELYTQKLYYDPEVNLYFLEDNFGLKSFESPEELVLQILSLDSYPLRFQVKNNLSTLYLKTNLEISYQTHLSKDLRFTKKERKIRLKAEKIFSLDEISNQN
ncbi:DUF4390 domain-containing protein [Thermodesulfobacterium sp. TA1]|uniref:DUF4390 domain-containing protein n=1 Tax=Thermodesulfobacterium sp. TA1 TaxID=2234087 RepID=UPI001231B7AC|nr:DUF4390 domain-containing protein [Thermodesulfobacterium sp. TA1]QER42412.1 DUF4390 domain-containing protein [Thermodesulfobacterium sp. TA1]